MTHEYEYRYYWTLNGKRINWIKPYQPVKTTPTTTSQQVLSQSIDTSLSDEEKNQFNLNDSYTLMMMMNDESGLWYFDVQNKVPHNVIITGIYQCIAINAFGKALSMPMRLEIALLFPFVDNLTLQNDFDHNDRLNISSTSSPSSTSSSSSLSFNNESLMIFNLTPSDTGLYTCIASTQLDSTNASIHLIIQGRPQPPKSVKLTCNHRNTLSPYVMLTWEIGETNNAPVEKVLITYITGFYRPMEGFSSFKQNTNDHVTLFNSEDFNHHIKSNHNNLYWLNKTALEIAQTMINQAILKDQWHSSDLVPEIKVIEYLKSKNHSLQELNIDHHRNSAKLPLNIGRAFIRLNSDVIYHFRIELLNHVGKSSPSDIIPKLTVEQNELCILPPEPTLNNPEYLIVYGNKPNNLIIQWKPLDPMEHNGPGLIYRFTIHCLDCIYGPSKNVLNYTIVRNWSKNRLELMDLITPRLSSNNIERNETDTWSIETFRTYQVTLRAENYLGSYGIKPLLVTGRSGEDIPQFAPTQLRILNIGSNHLLLSWKMIKDIDFTLKINGIFQGFRVEWCDADLSNDSCEFYKKFQDYILEQPPQWSFPHLRRKSTILLEKIDSTTTTTTDNNNSNNEMNVKNISATASSPLEHLHSNIKFENDHYKAYLNELPGKTKLKLWVRILNIQYAGPESDAIIVETKEGVPEKVSELTITFIGVNHIEVSWIKPIILNGQLISYDLEIYLNNFTETNKLFAHNSQMISSITINDPEQCATRIAGLKMNTYYSLFIWARTAVGRGQPAFVNFRTATLSQDYGHIPFKISSIEGHVNALNLTLITPLSSTLNNDLNSSELVNDNTNSSSSSSSSSSPTIPLTIEQNTKTRFNVNTVDEPIRKFNHHQFKSQFMFYVQFRQLGTEIWEETQRELYNSWVVLSNLHRGCQYEIRIVRITDTGQSTVSGSKIVQIPITHPTSLINNNWRIFSTHNQYLLIVMVLCCLFLIICLIGGISLLIYWFKHKSSSSSSSSTSSAKLSKHVNSMKKHNCYSQAFHCQSAQNNTSIDRFKQPYTNWTLNENLSPNHSDYLTDHNMLMLMNTDSKDTIYQLDRSCVCQSNDAYPTHAHDDENRTSDINNNPLPSLITTNCDPYVNNCVTFFKMPHSQTSTFITEENLCNSLINIETSGGQMYQSNLWSKL
ncbi:unnamed protein product [Schistosoma turkestanicum]|nr:unnamed protein product [Schistosoma turkestanicum]